MVFYKHHTATRAHRLAEGGFTLVEAVVAVSLIGIGVATTIGALTKFNSFAAMSRNGTGASALLQSQVDLFQSMSPFNPQPTKNQIPKDTANTPPTYDMTAGTHAIGYKDPTTTAASSNVWPVYREPARWTYADAAARTGASGFAMTDIGQLAYQKDTETYSVAIDVTDVAQDDSNGLIVKGTMSCAVTDISDTTTTPKIYRYQAVFTLTYTYLNRTYSSSMTVIRVSDI